MTLLSAINISEGRDATWLATFDQINGVIDRHSDGDHHRSVVSIVGELDQIVETAIDVATRTVTQVDLRRHEGLHPRFGAVDVVPFVAIGSANQNEAREARDRFAARLENELGVPSFFYGPLSDGSVRALPDLRRDAFKGLLPDVGGPEAHPSAGACAVGVRGPLVAWNLMVDGIDLSTGRAIAQAVRSTQLRAIALALPHGIQISCNLIDPLVFTPADAYDRIVERLDWRAHIQGGELVGTIPAASLAKIDPERWGQLDLAEEKTLEARAASKGISIL
jgi:glutamate formiminotransferase